MQWHGNAHAVAMTRMGDGVMRMLAAAAADTTCMGGQQANWGLGAADTGGRLKAPALPLLPPCPLTRQF
jgi:hypothetical protein